MPWPQGIIRDDDDSFDAAFVVLAVDFEGFAAVDALMSTDDDSNVPGQSGCQLSTGPNDQ